MGDRSTFVNAMEKVTFHEVRDSNRTYRCLRKRQNVQGKTIIKQGDAGDNFYVVDSGHCDIFVHGIGKVSLTKPKERLDSNVASLSLSCLGAQVAESSAGGSFGELALMYNAPRAASVVCDADLFLQDVTTNTLRSADQHRSH
jgi:CRP-like cAMP-binding protein